MQNLVESFIVPLFVEMRQFMDDDRIDDLGTIGEEAIVELDLLPRREAASIIGEKQSRPIPEGRNVQSHRLGKFRNPFEEIVKKPRLVRDNRVLAIGTDEEGLPPIILAMDDRKPFSKKEHRFPRNIERPVQMEVFPLLHRPSDKFDDLPVGMPGKGIASHLPITEPCGKGPSGSPGIDGDRYLPSVLERDDQGSQYLSLVHRKIILIFLALRKKSRYNLEAVFLRTWRNW